MENWIHRRMCELSREALKTAGLYSLMRQQGVNFHLAHQQVEAVNADEYQAQHLGVALGAALVSMARTTIDDTGRPVETGRHVYRADKYSFEATLRQY